MPLPMPPTRLAATPPNLPHLPTATRAAAAGLPSLIGKYHVRRKLGEGATSEVFLAHDPFNDVEVAIKRVRPGLFPDSREAHFQQRFFAAEAALVGRYCRADQLLPLQQVLEIGFKCAMALGYCFRQGLIHRDVKPANLLVTLAGDRIDDVKVTDFGSVFNLGSEHTQIYRVGSLAYMSLEQLEGDALDCRADMYSLAAVLYHLVAGRPPFDATQQQALMHQICHARPPPLCGLREGVPAALQSLIEACLAKDRTQRPADWDAFARALSRLNAEGLLPRGPLQEVLDSERFTLLRSLEFFAGFGDVELWEVVHRAQWQRHTCGQALFRKGEPGNTFHIVTQGQVEVYREGRQVATLGSGTSVGEMAYLAPSPELRLHTVDILVSQPATTVSFTPQSMEQFSLATRHLFDKAFIRVLVRRLHAAHEAAAHPRRIL